MDIKELLDIVTLKKIDDNRFEGKKYETVWGRVFGSQVLSQSLLNWYLQSHFLSVKEI